MKPITAAVARAAVVRSTLRFAPFGALMVAGWSACSGPSSYPKCGQIAAIGNVHTLRTAGDLLSFDAMIWRLLQRCRTLQDQRAMSRAGFVAALLANLFSHAFSVPDPGFVCVGLDWWPAKKCDYDWCPWHNSSIWAIDLEEIKPYARPLAPFLLRVGGSLQDQVIFQEAECNFTNQFPLEPDSRLGFGDGCISQNRLQELSDFCHDVGCQFVWGLNALYGRSSNGTGEWDSSNSEAMLNFSRSISFPLYALTLDNEVWGEFIPLNADQAVNSFIELDRLVTKIWDPTDRPVIVGFDGYYGKNQGDFIAGVLVHLFDAGVNFDVLSYHTYPLGSSKDEGVVKRALTHNPAVNDLGHLYTQVAQDSPFSPSPRVWMSEGGGSYNSGSPQATGSFASGFWYLDNMAMLHQIGFKHFCRQTLAGGNYGLLDQVSPRTPHPDYWNAVLYQNVLGKPMSSMLRPANAEGGLEALGTTIICESMDGMRTTYSSFNESHVVRWYFYEAKKPKKSFAVLGINFDPQATCGLQLGQNISLMVYAMSPADGHESDPWNTTGTRLNEELLTYDGKGGFPTLDGAPKTGDTLWLEPLSYAYFEVSDDYVTQE